MAGSRSALIVATQTYEDAGLTRLQAPDADARALAAVLADPDIGDFDVTTVVDGRAHEVNRAVASFFRDRRADDLLLLHFSCHGLKDDSGELYFAATDTDLELLDATAVPAGFVNRAMDRSRAGRVLLLLDCCYAGAFARGMTARAAGSVDVNERLGGRGRAVITASSALQFAFEGQALADVASAAPSVFTSALVRGLETGEADRNLDGWISLDELYAYVHDEVTRDNPDQTPKKWAFDIEGDLYVAKRGLPVTTPSELPQEIRRTLGSLLTWERASAVEPLTELLVGDHPGLALAARQALEGLAGGDDSARVRGAAHAVLQAHPGPGTPAVPGPRVSPDADPTPTVPVRQVAATADAPPVSPPTARPPGPPHRPGRPVVLAAAAVVVLGILVTWLVLPRGDSPGGSDTADLATLPTSEILVTKKVSGGYQLLAYDVDTKSQKVLEGFPADATMPVINRQRTEVVYQQWLVDGGRVPHLADVDGSNDRPLLDDEASKTCPYTSRVAWSPDGGHVAFVCYDSTVYSSSIGLYVYDRSGQELTRVVPGPLPTGTPTWAGNDEIIYPRRSATSGAPTLLMRVPAAGGESVQVTQDDAGWEDHPDWTEQGLAFQQSDGAGRPGGLVWWQDGAVLASLSDGDDAWPSVSPDGTAVAYLRDAADGGQTLWIATPGQGGDPTEVSGALGPPSWGDI